MSGIHFAAIPWRGIAWFFLCTAALAAAPAQAGAEANRPNILWLVSDDHAAHVTGCYGNTMARTPNLDRMATVWNTGWVPSIVMIITFVCVLFTSVQVAVGVGVAFHIIFYLYKSDDTVRVERIVPLEEGGFIEAEVPDTLTEGELVVL